MGQAFLWWAAFVLLGLATLPIAATFFGRLPDRGYSFAKPLGLLLFGYFYWILVMARVPNSRLGVLLALALLLAISGVIWLRRRVALQASLRGQVGRIIAIEAAFAVVFLIWAVLRAHWPDISHTEQPMDLGMLNAIRQSPHFPPNDPWFAGQPISYYYFGYLMFTGVAKLLGTASAVAYNLAFPVVAGMAAAAIFGLVGNVVSTWRGKPASFRASVMFGALAVLLLLFIGNLVGALEYLQANNLGSMDFWHWLRIDGLTGQSPGGTWYPNEQGWWWWRSTRVIDTFGSSGQALDYTITEFPYFSFLLGDLHPHVMALPFDMLAIGVAYAIFKSEESIGLGWLRRHPLQFLVGSLTIGALGFLNTWDLPTFTLLLFACVLLQGMRVRRTGGAVSYRSMVATMGLFVLVEVLLYAPFYLFLHSQAKGILPVREAMTRPLHLALVLGPLLLLATTMLVTLAWQHAKGKPLRLLGATRSRVAWAVGIPLAPMLLWALVELGLIAVGQQVGLTHERTFADGLLAIGSRFWHVLPFIALIAVGLNLIFTWVDEEADGRLFLLLLVVVALFLVYGAELFHIADLFGNRMNTVFKFYYQAWELLAVGAAVGAYFWWTKLRQGRESMPAPAATNVARPSRALASLAAGILVIGGVLVCAAFLYVPAATHSVLRDSSGVVTLDGLAWVARGQPAEYAATAALVNDAAPGAVIVEGLALSPSGQPIGDYDPAVARISARTGLPTVLGWPGHEQQWGRDYATEIAPRVRDIGSVYGSNDVGAIGAVLRKYDVQYVVVGDLERRSYGPAAGTALAALMDILYQNERVVIYKTR